MIVVLGGGVAGTGAAIAAARMGARVTLVDGGVGASTLWTGAVDGEGNGAVAVRELAGQLGVSVSPTSLVTTAGHVRSAVGRDVALLDLHAVGADRTPIGVVRCHRPGWSADAVVRAAGSGFHAVDATVLRHADERALPDADFAARHDDDARLAWLAERLRDALQRAGGVRALLLPPSLGVSRERASDLSRWVGVVCGEAMGLPGGPAGLRFEHARDRALEGAGVEAVQGRALAIEATAAGARWRVAIDGHWVEADALIVACGGLIGGGLEYQPSEWMLAAALPPVARLPFRCTIEGPLRLGAHGKPLTLPGSLFGLPPEAIAWPLARDPLLDRVGVLCSDDGRVAPGLLVAGEVVADAPRTWLCALESGVRAGAAAARDALTSTASRSPSPAPAPASRP